MSAKLYNCSSILVHWQGNVEERLTTYSIQGKVLPEPTEGWYDGASWVIGRELRNVRRLVQSGQQQVATRELLRRLEIFKEVWDAYRASASV